LPEIFHRIQVLEIDESSVKILHSTDHHVDSEQIESPVVSQPNAVRNPRTVVIHSELASTTISTVLRSHWLPDLAILAGSIVSSYRIE